MQRDKLATKARNSGCRHWQNSANTGKTVPKVISKMILHHCMQVNDEIE